MCDFIYHPAAKTADQARQHPFLHLRKKKHKRYQTFYARVRAGSLLILLQTLSHLFILFRSTLLLNVTMAASHHLLEGVFRDIAIDLQMNEAKANLCKEKWLFVVEQLQGKFYFWLLYLVLDFVLFLTDKLYYKFLVNPKEARKNFFDKYGQSDYNERLIDLGLKMRCQKDVKLIPDVLSFHKPSDMDLCDVVEMVSVFFLYSFNTLKLFSWRQFFFQ